MTGVQDGTPTNEAAGVPPWAAELLRLYDSCNAALGQLDALSQRQRSLIDMEDPEPLLALMTQRQHTAEALARDAPRRGRSVPRTPRMSGACRRRCAGCSNSVRAGWRGLRRA